MSRDRLFTTNRYRSKGRYFVTNFSFFNVHVCWYLTKSSRYLQEWISRKELTFVLGNIYTFPLNELRFIEIVLDERYRFIREHRGTRFYGIPRLRDARSFKCRLLYIVQIRFYCTTVREGGKMGGRMKAGKMGRIGVQRSLRKRRRPQMKFEIKVNPEALMNFFHRRSINRFSRKCKIITRDWSVIFR